MHALGGEHVAVVVLVALYAGFASAVIFQRLAGRFVVWCMARQGERETPENAGEGGIEGL